MSIFDFSPTMSNCSDIREDRKQNIRFVKELEFCHMNRTQDEKRVGGIFKRMIIMVNSMLAQDGM